MVFSDVGLLLISLVGVILSSELIVRGAVNLAEHFKISKTFLGLTIIAIGTDLPELSVVIFASIKKMFGVETSGLIVGEVVGSSIAQISLVLGILGLGGVLYLTKKQLWRDGFAMVASVVLLLLLGADGRISAFDGVVLLITYITYFFTLQREEMVKEKIRRAPKVHLIQDISSLVLGFIVIIFFSRIVVDKSIFLADIWNIKQSLVGILFIGLGTSLPELAVSVTALRRKAYGLSIGNLIGSNIFDTLVPTGLAGVLTGVSLNRSLLLFDLPALFILSVLVVFFFLYRGRLRRWEAWILIIFYFVYVVLVFHNAGFF